MQLLFLDIGELKVQDRDPLGRKKSCDSYNYLGVLCGENSQTLYEVGRALQSKAKWSH